MSLAVLWLFTCVGDATYGNSHASQRAKDTERAQLDVTVSNGDSRVPDATVIAVGEGHEHVASAKTDWSGRVPLILTPGHYRVSVLAAGQQGRMIAVRARAGGAVAVQLQVAPTDPFALVPPGMGVVSGRIVDEKGGPVTHASLTLDDPNDSTYNVTGWTSADGSFRFNARAHPSPEARYRRLQVTPIPHFPFDVPAIAFLPHPTTQAVSVQVREKQETAGLEVRVRTAPRFRATVTLRDELGAVPVNATVTLFGRDGASERQIRSDGTATLGPLQPGRVTLWASADGATGTRLAGVSEFEIEDRAIDDIVVTLFPAARLHGRVEFAKGTVPASSALRMLVRSAVPGHPPVSYRSNESNGSVAEDGSFTIEGLLGSRCLQVTNPPAGWRLDTIVMGGRDITDEPLVFAPAGDVTDMIVRLVPDDASARSRPMCDPR